MKKILISLFLLLSIISGAGLVFGNFINFEKSISFIEGSSKNIISDHPNLNSVILTFSSNTDISKGVIQSKCNTHTDFLKQIENTYYFRLTLLENNCQNPHFSLKIGKEIFSNTNFTLNIQQKSDIVYLVVDYPNEKILSAKKVVDKKVSSYSIYKNISETQGAYHIPLLKKQRKFQELSYKQDILKTILDKRKSKYSIPVKGYELSDSLNLIPNADRRYRNDYTDGIHHGWDIMAPQGTPVSAIDDGVIIRVVRDFEFADLSNIKRGDSLTHSEKLRNLDILRGSQVWLKTMKGDVIFYSHLDKVYENIKEGMLLQEGDDIGTIGVSGVPDKSYKDYHLHFPIQKNPYDLSKAGKYSLEDIMDWDWYLKGLDATSVIKGKDDIFKSPEQHNH